MLIFYDYSFRLEKYSRSLNPFVRLISINMYKYHIVKFFPKEISCTLRYSKCGKAVVWHQFIRQFKISVLGSYGMDYKVSISTVYKPRVRLTTSIGTVF